MPHLYTCASRLLCSRSVLHSAAAPMGSFSRLTPQRALQLRRFSEAPAVPAALVKALRERTGASIGKCREALCAEGGDAEKAAEWLRKRGIRSMERRAADSGEALLALNIGSSVGGLVEVRAETDFVTRGMIFQRLSLCLASVAARAGASSPTGLGEATLLEADCSPAELRQLRAGTAVDAALLELGSVVGERLVVGKAHHLAAPSGGVVAGYAHPKQADGLPGTGRIAALVALKPEPAESCDLDRLHEMAGQLARHVAAAQPRFLNAASIPEDVRQKEEKLMREAHLEQLGPKKAAAVDEKVLTKVLEGKMKKFCQETVLLSQELVAAPSQSAAAMAEGGKPEPAKPIVVSEWLRAEAKAMSLQELTVAGFQLATI